MDIIIKIALVHSISDVEVFSIKVTNFKYQLVRKKLELEKKKIIDIFKLLKSQGEIKSIFRPKNKKIQKQLDELVKAKKILKESIKSISEVFYK